MKARRLITILTNISTVTMLVFLYIFVSRNAPGLTNLYAITAVALVYALLYLGGAGILLQALATGQAEPRRVWPARILLVLCSAGLVFVFLDSTVTDYYQPLSLYNEAIGLLALWWILLIAQNMVGLFTAREVARPLALLALLALLGWPVAASLWWLNKPTAGEDVADTIPVFVGGEDGYAIYRIPGFLAIPRGATLANGQTLAADRLVAIAEARRDGALDTGVIDLALKISNDHGASWSEQVIVCRHQLGQRRGKCGNPTPVFDRRSGKLILAYNLSGLEADPGYHSAHLVISEDGGTTWGEPRKLAQDNFVFGPGKGSQKKHAPDKGRLLLPGHVDGQAYVYYSDDSGQTWMRGGGLEGGNETDVAELADGRLYLTTRHIAPISRAPNPNGRLFSISTDGGLSWPPAALDEALPTPVCQVAVLQADDGGLLFSNPAHRESRVQMTVRYSGDGGASWPRSVLVYPGPAGYSVLAQGSDGSVFLLYENGNMAYSERISLARIPLSHLLPAPVAPDTDTSPYREKQASG
jgi:sialidase-1